MLSVAQQHPAVMTASTVKKMIMIASGQIGGRKGLLFS
jgi:hypothetical protein